MPSRFAFPKIRRFHPHDTTNEDGTPSINQTVSNSSNSIDATTTTSTTGTSGRTRTDTHRTRRTRGHEHRRHSRHSHSSSKPHLMQPSEAHQPIQNFRLRWIDHEHDECPVCTKQFEINCVVTLLPCGHYFCQSCMDQWFWKNHSSTCPLCRYDVTAANNDPCGDDEFEDVDDDDDFLDKDYQDWRHHHHHSATEKKSSHHHLAGSNSTDYLSLVTKVVLTGDMSDAKCEKITDSLACDGVNSSFGNNFDLIMAKALHARRARMAYEMSSSMMDSFILDNQD